MWYDDLVYYFTSYMIDERIHRKAEINSIIHSSGNPEIWVQHYTICSSGNPEIWVQQCTMCRGHYNHPERERERKSPENKRECLLDGKK
jgi:hypothetical protein